MPKKIVIPSRHTLNVCLIDVNLSALRSCIVRLTDISRSIKAEMIFMPLVVNIEEHCFTVTPLHAKLTFITSILK